MYTDNYFSRFVLPADLKDALQKSRYMVYPESKEELMETLSKETPEVLVTFGAGNIDRFVEPITQMLESRYK